MARLIAAFLTCILVTFADNPKTSNATHRLSAAEVFLNESVGYAVEVRAYTLFAVYADLPQGKLQTAILEDVLNAATQAQFKFPVISIIPSTDDLATYRERMSPLGVDELSIELRLVSLARAISVPHAIAIFTRVRYPLIPRIDCLSASVPDMSGYFKTLATLYTAIPRGTAEHRELRDVIAKQINLMTMVDVAPIAALIADLQSDSEWRYWVDEFIGRLPYIYTDDRSAYVALVREGLSQQVGRLLEPYAQLTGTPVPLLAAYRKLLLSVYSGERCADNVAFEKQSADHSPFSPEKAFNDLLATVNVGPAAVEPLTAKDVATDHTPLVRNIDTSFWQTMTEKQLLTLVQDLRQGVDQDTKLPAVESTINDLVPGVDDDPVRLFHEKAIAYRALLGAALSDSKFQVVVSDIASFLSSADGAVPYADWLLEVERFCDLARKNSESTREMRTFEEHFKVPFPVVQVLKPPVILAEMAKSRAPELSMIARLEQQYPTERRAWR